MMFHARKRLLQVGASTIDKGSLVRLPWSSTFNCSRPFVTEPLCSHRNQVPFFLLGLARKATSFCVEALAQNPEDASGSKDALVQTTIAHDANEKAWCLPSKITTEIKDRIAQGSNEKACCLQNTIENSDAPVDTFVHGIDEKLYSLPSENTTERKDVLDHTLVHGVNEKPWSLPSENALKLFLPLSFSALLLEFNQPMTLEYALSFLSWACKQPGFVLCTDDVNQIARLWASKYAAFALTDLAECLNAEGSKYTEATWATLMTTSTFLDKPEQSVRIFMESQKHGCVPSQLLYDPFVFALIKCRQHDRAILTVQEMLASKIFPGEKVLGSFLDALCKAGKAKNAHKLVHDIALLSSASFRDSAYSRLITAVWRTAHSSMALDLLNEMISEGFKPDKQAYAACVILLCKKRRFDLAQSLLESMCEHGCSPDLSTYTTLVNGLYKAGKAKKALEVTELLEKEGKPLDCKMQTAFLSCLFAAGRVDDAIHKFEQMQRDSSSEDPIIYYVMIKNLCESGDIERAFNLKKSMNKKGFESDERLYQALQRGVCAAGGCHVDQLLLLVEEIKTKGFSPCSESYLTLVTHFCSLGDFKVARAWAEEMVNEGHKPTPYIRTRFPEMQDVFKKG